MFFYVDAPIFTSDEEREGGKNQVVNYFCRMLLKFEEKKFKIHLFS